MMRMICFGDSNTYGYDAASIWGERLGREERWPEVFGRMSGWETVNEGLNGREIPDGARLRPFDMTLERVSPFDLLAVMLGTNDILRMLQPDAREAGRRMEAFAKHALEHPRIGGDGSRILIIAPVKTDIGRYGREEEAFDREVLALGPIYKKTAEAYGLRFLDASGWEIPLAGDGVHFTGEGHRRFAGELDRRLLGEK